MSEPAAEPGRIPGTVTAAVVLLYLGGGVALLAAVLGFVAGAIGLGAVLFVIGALNVWLGYQLRQRKQWARVTMLVLSALGAVASVVQWAASGRNAVAGLVWAAVYLTLLMTPTARAWFRPQETDR
jgi:drug/metabolite transporter superfamily protein YnfA